MRALYAAVLILVATATWTGRAGVDERFVPMGMPVDPPVGWKIFCENYPGECVVLPEKPRKIKSSSRVLQDLLRINLFVNKKIKPLSDLQIFRTPGPEPLIEAT